MFLPNAGFLGLISSFSCWFLLDMYGEISWLWCWISILTSRLKHKCSTKNNLPPPDVRALLQDEAAAAESYPEYNKAYLVSLELPDRSGDIIITTYGELDKNDYIDPRTAQVATVDHVKQNCPVHVWLLCHPFCNGNWRSVWTLEFSYAFQLVEIKGKIQVGAHYFEEGNVQLDTDVDRKDSTLMQTDDIAWSQTQTAQTRDCQAADDIAWSQL
uniref:Uncharacterized protein n=1 Tax=Avena sativa TaxID=4498 RepID=A0ACD5XT46_AVESA